MFTSLTSGPSNLRIEITVGILTILLPDWDGDTNHDDQLLNRSRNFGNVKLRTSSVLNRSYFITGPVDEKSNFLTLEIHFSSLVFQLSRGKVYNRNSEVRRYRVIEVKIFSTSRGLKVPSTLHKSLTIR